MKAYRQASEQTNRYIMKNGMNETATAIHSTLIIRWNL